MDAPQPPTIKGRRLAGSLREFHTEAFDFLLRAAQEHGDIVRFYLGPREVYLINRPELIRDVLVTHSQNFIKGPGQQLIKPFLGEGLLLSEGEYHLRQRRLSQPAFHKKRIHEYARIMVDNAADARDRWADGQTLNVSDEMTRLTMSIVTKALFGKEVEPETVTVAQALLIQHFQGITRPLPRLMSRLPLPSNFRTRRTLRRLNEIIYRIIDERRKEGEDRGDFLSMLIAATDDEGDGTGMTDEQVRDELVTILVAGHETVSSALPWTWYLLAQHPVIEARLHDEIDSVLQGRLPTADDYPRLPFVAMVFSESMRLYPPIWAFSRQAINDYKLDQYTVPAGGLITISPYVTHHDARFYPDPFKFDPDRWTPELKAARPKFAFFPFGGGPRQCIGDGFAWMEAILLIATFAQKWRLRLVPGQTVVPRPSPGLRVKALHMTAHAREVAAGAIASAAAMPAAASGGRGEH
jgi:cytochrome P450